MPLRTGTAALWVLAATGMLLAVAAVPAPAAGPEGEANVRPGNLGQMIMAVLVFLVLLAILGKFAWKPIVKQIREREQNITNAVEQAKRHESQARELLAAHEAKLEMAETQAKEILDRSRQEAATAREELIAQAAEEARRSAESARTEIEHAKGEALKELYDQTAELATEMAEQILRKSIDPADQQRLIAESLEDIRKRAGEES
jgi:F-type H+-transporting ATPase subunit b